MAVQFLLLAIVALNTTYAVLVGALTDEPACPYPPDIEPCECRFHKPSITMVLNCSLVASEKQLAQIFSASMPWKYFTMFYMHNNSDVKVLRDGVFGTATFEQIWIVDGSLEVVEEGALSGSYSTANSIRFIRNRMSSFPFQDLPHFEVLETLFLQGNQFDTVPQLRSSTLTTLDLGQNPLLELPETAVKELPMLKICYFDKTSISSFLSGTFSGLDHLWRIELSNNAIQDVPNRSISLAGHQQAFVWLNSNGIVNIDASAITGLGGGKLYLANNSLTLLDEAVFKPLLEDVSYINLTENPLTCECDIAWLVTNATLLRRLMGHETCSNGTRINDLDPNAFDNC